jgi:NitT/TauT family transport system substrate-binding protein
MFALMITGCVRAEHVAGGGPVTPLMVYGSTETLEIAPVLLAARDHYPQGAVVRKGGIGNLVGAAPVAALGGDGGVADVATHAETQALRYSVTNPEIRIILVVTEGRYRIVARRSAGIASLADLKGKRVATLATTSAGFFLARMLEQAKLTFADITPVRISPIDGLAASLTRGEVDAVAIWEPHGGNAAQPLGADAIEFAGDGVYRELFNLNTTAANLVDPDKRRRIVAFVRAVMDATQAIHRDSGEAQALVAATSGFSADEVSRSWPTLHFPAALPSDLIDTLVAEEAWLAAQDRRTPRSREALARLIDASVYEEARRR